MTALKSRNSRIRTLLSCAALATFMLAPSNAFGLGSAGPGDAALAGGVSQNFDSEATDSYFTSQSPKLTGFNRRGYFGATEVPPSQYFTVGSAGDDRAPIDDFSFVRVPEPNIAMLLGLSLLTLAGTRIRDLQPRPRPPAPAEPEVATETHPGKTSTF